MRELVFKSLGPRGFHSVAYAEWGEPDNDRVVVCVHGLTRNGRDFDDLAHALSSQFRVLCPDVVGRGRSEWLQDKSGYGYPVYLADMAALLARTGVQQVYWVGTSMGGLIGMLLAALPATPIAKLVMNDVGPFVPKAALERIASYVGNDPRFGDEAELGDFLKTIYAPFGPYEPEQWDALVAHSMRSTPEGDIGLNYDPGIGVPFTTGTLEDVDLWQSWDAISCPVLLIRGADSDLLLEPTAQEMQRRGPGAAQRVSYLEVPGVGHAPSLVSRDQVETVKHWLLD